MDKCKQPRFELAKSIGERWNAAIARHRNGEPMEHFSDAEREILDQWRESSDRCRAFLKSRGARYSECEFENFVCSCKAQTETIEKLMAYAQDSEDRIKEGQNVILFGPRGTGKDHLLTALARNVARWSAACVKWVNGVDLMTEFRDHSLGKPGRITVSRQDYYDKCDILLVSDPLPPSGVLSDFQQTEMFRLIDTRYASLRPTWITVNCASGAELASRIGAQTADRLRHGALAIHCDWPSYRTGG